LHEWASAGDPAARVAPTIVCKEPRHIRSMPMPVGVRGPKPHLYPHLYPHVYPHLCRGRWRPPVASLLDVGIMRPPHDIARLRAVHHIRRAGHPRVVEGRLLLLILPLGLVATSALIARALIAPARSG